MKDIHIGDIIHQKVKERGLSITQFAHNINRARTTVYDIYNRKSIDIDLLLVISEVLNFNFLSEVYLNENFAHIYEKSQSAHYLLSIEVDEQLLQRLGIIIGQAEMSNIVKIDKV